MACPYTHQQQGSVERRHRQIVETGLALLASSSVPQRYWDEAFVTASFLINRLPTPMLKNKSPTEKLFHKPPDYNFLRVFGCACWPHLRPYNKHKMDFRSKMCVFLGYSPQHHGYKCLHFPTGRIYISRNVVFDEELFPFAATSNISDSQVPNDPTLILPQNIHVLSNTAPAATPRDGLTLPQNIRVLPTMEPAAAQRDVSITAEPEIGSTLDPITSPATCQELGDPSNPSRPTHPPPQQHTMLTRSRNNITKPTHKYDDFITRVSPHALIAATTLEGKEPTCYSEATRSHEWRAAMNMEFTALMHNGTWTLVPPQSTMNLVGCKWVFKIKRKSDGSIDRYKARLVAKGYHQQPGIDFDETYSPVVKPTTIRMVLSLAVTNDWPIRQLDVQNAFLHGDLQENVYMSQPPGFIHPLYPNHVCHLRKALYGLKQAPRAWFSRLSSTLSELGFIRSQADSSLFIYRNSKDEFLFILIYVDDILVTGPSQRLITHMVQKLQSDFALKDLGPLAFFLGIEAIQVTDGLLLSQQRYITDLLHKTNMDKAKPISSPMSTTAQLSQFHGDSFHDPHLYRSVVGSLQYLSLTRPDVSFAVNKVCQFMHKPTVHHWSAVKRILRYLQQTASLGLLIRKASSSCLQAYSDSDWAGCPDDRRSTGGLCVFLGSNLISWSSRKQATVSRSSTEAEYRAVANTAAELIWLQSLLRELGVFLHHPPTLWCDNVGATYLTANPIFHARTKHIEIDVHFVREKVTNGALVVKFISSKDQLADLFTKALPTARFLNLRDNLNVSTSPLSLRGRIKAHSSNPTSGDTGAGQQLILTADWIPHFRRY
ncbi:hypothetical protein SLA2020_435440 [Shorea laevis]